jgi:hypothetical protein
MRSPYLDALLNPLNLAMLALTAAAGLCSAWWLFPVGVLLWGGMVLIHANDPVLKMNFKLQERATALSQRFQTQFDKITRSQVRIFNAIQSSRGHVRVALAPVHDEIESLTDSVFDLCQRMTAPENYYLVTKRNGDLDGERALAVLALQGETDPTVKQEKQEALNAIDKRAQQLKDLATLLERVETHLANVDNEMASWMSDILRLQALPANEAPKQAQALLDKIKIQKEKLADFDEAVTHLP